jgi:hypothetical protein
VVDLVAELSWTMRKPIGSQAACGQKRKEQIPRGQEASSLSQCGAHPRLYSRGSCGL